MPRSDETSSVFDVGPIAKKVSFSGWKTGDVIDGKLEIRELIGKGGMGVVWRVHHREWNRSLAVKMPLPALVGSPTARDRFLREAETWIDLGVHPHIVQCWFVMDIEGLPSLFLDYLTGGSLKQWIDAGHVQPGQWKRILEIAIQVSEGLAYSHSHGVIHRDVKPANLLIRGDERVCVTDFGIVKTAGDTEVVTGPVDFQELSDDISITGTGAFLGTPQYGAPEQWGSAEEVDERADIYALGVTLFEMCCGRRPFDSSKEKAKPEVLIERHLSKPAPDPREFFPDVPADLAQLALLCLEKDPQKRPQTMERLREALCTIYQRIVGQAYQGVGSVPSEQRADTLNNRAVSLYSLSKRHDARDVWRRGLRIESGHPECLYNLTQVDRRSGRMESDEALRRLRQAKAGLPLALLCIEQGRPQEAVDILNSIQGTEENKEGPIQRTLGDAYMYTRQYFAAEKAYRLALASMPADADTQDRKRLASVGKRSLSGRILFPSEKSVFNVVVQDPNTKILITPDSECAVGVSAGHITVWDIEQECVRSRTARSSGASSPKRAWLKSRRLLVEDERSFELRRWPDLELVGRKDGEILAVTSNLNSIVVSDQNGVYIFDVKGSGLDKVHFPDNFPPGRLLVCFDHTGKQVCMLTPQGRIAQVDSENEVVLEDWPEEVEEAGDASCMRLSRDGAVLYIGHHSGRLQALDFTTRSRLFDLRLPFPIVTVHLCSEASTMVVELQPGFVVIDKKGRILCQGDGPVTIDRSRNRCLAFQQKRLVLYDLRPFRPLRTWEQYLEDPKAVCLASDGRLAVSMDTGGRFDVWEADEDNRVYERFFLLSPGKSYAEIVNASKRFRDSMTQAQECFTREQPAVAYRHLNRARSVIGYAQAPEALDLNWKLLAALRRESLEAVWERLSLESEVSGEPPGPIALSDDGRHILVTFGAQASLYFDTGSETKKLWSLKTRGITAATAIINREGTAPVVALLDTHGGGGLYSLEKGHPVKALSVDRGLLRRVQMAGTVAAYFSERGSIGLFDLLEDEVVVETHDIRPDPVRLFPWKEDCLITVSQEGTSTLNLSKSKLRPLTFKSVDCTAPLTFAASRPDLSLTMLGFEDSLIVICEMNKLRPILKLQHPGAGAITGFALIESITIGVASTDQGRLLFWDMRSGVLLDEFSGHRCGIISLCVSDSARYILTAGSDGQVRLWETSWACDASEPEIGLTWLPTPTAFSKLGKFLGFGG